MYQKIVIASLAKREKEATRKYKELQRLIYQPEIRAPEPITLARTITATSASSLPPPPYDTHDHSKPHVGELMLLFNLTHNLLNFHIGHVSSSLQYRSYQQLRKAAESAQETELEILEKDHGEAAFKIAAESAKNAVQLQMRLRQLAASHRLLIAMDSSDEDHDTNAPMTMSLDSVRSMPAHRAVRRASWLSEVHSAQQSKFSPGGLSLPTGGSQPLKDEAARPDATQGSEPPAPLQVDIRSPSSSSATLDSVGQSSIPFEIPLEPNRKTVRSQSFKPIKQAAELLEPTEPVLAGPAMPGKLPQNAPTDLPQSSSELLAQPQGQTPASSQISHLPPTCKRCQDANTPCDGAYPACYPCKTAGFEEECSNKSLEVEHHVSSRVHQHRGHRGPQRWLTRKQRKEALLMRKDGACAICRKRKTMCDDGYPCQACIEYYGVSEPLNHPCRHEAAPVDVNPAGLQNAGLESHRLPTGSETQKPPVIMSIQQELSDGKSIAESAAAREIDKQLAELQLKNKEKLDDVKHVAQKSLTAAELNKFYSLRIMKREHEGVDEELQKEQDELRKEGEKKGAGLESALEVEGLEILTLPRGAGPAGPEGAERYAPYPAHVNLGEYGQEAGDSQDSIEDEAASERNYRRRNAKLQTEVETAHRLMSVRMVDEATSLAREYTPSVSGDSNSSVPGRDQEPDTQTNVVDKTGSERPPPNMEMAGQELGDRVLSLSAADAIIFSDTMGKFLDFDSINPLWSSS
jgi:hypothetical protein